MDISSWTSDSKSKCGLSPASAWGSECDRRCFSSVEIGFGLTAFGVLFTFLGVLLFFDQALLTMGNVRTVLCGDYFMFGCLAGWFTCLVVLQLMFLIGITLTIGASHVASFFLNRKKLRVCAVFDVPCLVHTFSHRRRAR